MIMTKMITKEFVNAIVKLREILTDEQAIEVQALFPAWREDVSYKAGERVLYQNVLYKAIKDHTSKLEEDPSIATNLYEKVVAS